MELLITEITDMSADMMCIASWDREHDRMLRPLPDGNHWPAKLVADLGLTPGSTINVKANNKAHGGDYPHSTEDFEVLSGSISFTGDDEIDWFGAGAPVAAASIAEGFGNSVEHNNVWKGRLQGVYVPRGTVCSSLIGLNVNSDNIELFEAFDSLKARVDDGDSAYEMKVSCHELHAAYDRGGITRARRMLPRNMTVHARIGLARGWKDQPDKCYVMLNGVNW